MARLAWLALLALLAAPAHAEQVCSRTITGTVKATGTLEITLDEPPGGTDTAPVIGGVTLSNSTCTTPCTDLTFSGSFTSGGEPNYIWKYDLPDQDAAPDKCASVDTACTDACWTNSITGVTTNYVNAAPLPDLTTLGTQRIWFCATDADGDASVDAAGDPKGIAKSVQVKQQTLAGSVTVDPTTCTAGLDCDIDVTLTIDPGSTCPWNSGDGYDVLGSCTAPCVRDAGFEATDATDGTLVFPAACSCPAGTTGTKFANAQLSGCGTAPTVSVRKDFYVTPAPVDPTPAIDSAVFSSPSCVAGTDCDAVTLTASCVTSPSDTCADTPIVWHFDGDGDCLPDASCNDPCYETADVDELGVTPVPEFADTGVSHTAYAQLCAEDSDGDDSVPYRMSIQVLPAPPTFDAGLSATPTSVAIGAAVTVKASYSGTYSGATTFSNHTCGTDGTASGTQSAGDTTTAPNTVMTCTYTTAGTKTIGVVISDGTNVRNRTVQVQVASPGLTFQIFLEPLDANGVTTGGTEPFYATNFRVYATGTCFSQAGIQPLTDIRLDTDGDGSWDYVMVNPDCSPNDCSATSGGNAYVSFAVRGSTPPWPGLPGILYNANPVAPATSQTFTPRAQATACDLQAQATTTLIVQDTGGGPTGSLVATPSVVCPDNGGLCFTYEQGSSTLPAAKDIAVTSTGAVVAFTATENPDVGWLSLSVTPPGGGGGDLASYTKTFSGSEDPLSDGGNWVNNNPNLGPNGGAFNRLEVYSGVATQSFDWGRYDGSMHLANWANPDQWAEGTWYADPAFTFNALSEATISVRMTTRATSTQADPYMEAYHFPIGIYGLGGIYGTTKGIGVWDGTAATFNPDFYTTIAPTVSSGTCANGPRSGDTIRLTVQGQNPPTLYSYMKRGAGAWTLCQGPVYDYGGAGLNTTGPTWHTPFLTGAPGMTSFTQNDGSPRHAGWTAFAAGTCPALPASCAP